MATNLHRHHHPAILLPVCEVLNFSTIVINIVGGKQLMHNDVASPVFPIPEGRLFPLKVIGTVRENQYVKFI